MASIRFHRVDFAYTDPPDGLFSGLGFGVSEGWTGVIGANGIGKTTLMRLACGELAPRRGAIDAPARTLYCPQRTDTPMRDLPAFLDASDSDAYRLRGRLGVEPDWIARWDTLSHGERKRAQIATCLWLDPDLLAVDEPTNHLDAGARELVRQALGSYRGIGLLVSHDRELLDGLCGHCLWVASRQAQLRHGGYTTVRAAMEQEAERLRELKSRAQTDRRRIEREVARRRSFMEKAERAKSLRGANPRDSDARERAYAERGKDSAKSLRQLAGRLEHARERERLAVVEPRTRLGIGLRGSASTRNTLLRLPAGVLPLGASRSLSHPDLLLQPKDRVALVGPNGAGKSSLVRHIVERLDLPRDRYTYIAQEIDEQTSQDVLDRVRRTPRESLGRIMMWVARLGSDPGQLLGSRLPSPGEVRKLLLAERMSAQPHLIIMDEPTNHMDLPSIECVEQALRAFCGALLLVSHDTRFLSALTAIRWEISSDRDTGCHYRLHIRRRRTAPPGPSALTPR